MSAGRTKKDKYSVHQLSYHPNHNIILFVQLIGTIFMFLLLFYF